MDTQTRRDASSSFLFSPLDCGNLGGLFLKCDKRAKLLRQTKKKRADKRIGAKKKVHFPSRFFFSVKMKLSCYRIWEFPKIASDRKFPHSQMRFKEMLPSEGSYSNPADPNRLPACQNPAPCLPGFSCFTADNTEENSFPNMFFQPNRRNRTEVKTCWNKTERWTSSSASLCF